MLQTRFKICCIACVEEARFAVEAGASAVGLVSAMPSGPGPIPEDLIAEIADSVPPAVDTFLLACLQDADAIVAQQRRCRTSAIQLCDSLDHRQYPKLRRALPGIRIIQVIHVTGPESVDEAVSISPQVHAILLDSGNPSLAVKELGGTGRVHDWAVSRRIRDAVKVPIFLAGGLTAENVGAAIQTVNPYAVDVCSGVRTNGQLDPEKLAAFVREVKASAPDTQARV